MKRPWQFAAWLFSPIQSSAPMRDSCHLSKKEKKKIGHALMHGQKVLCDESILTIGSCQRLALGTFKLTRSGKPDRQWKSQRSKKEMNQW